MADTDEKRKRFSELSGNSDPSKGICCPVCGCRDLRIYGTKEAPGDKVIRYRRCRNCGKRITTTEKAA